MSHTASTALFIASDIKTIEITRLIAIQSGYDILSMKPAIMTSVAIDKWILKFLSFLRISFRPFLAYP